MVKAILFYYPAKMPTPSEERYHYCSVTQLMKGFQSIGYQVDLIAGSSLEQSLLFSAIKNKAEDNYYYEFAYIETTAVPTNELLSSFLGWAKSKGTIITTNYKYLAWQFPDVRHYSSRWIRWLNLQRYKRELKTIQQFSDIFYIPDQNMLPALPGFFKHAHIKTLLPGCSAPTHPSSYKPAREWKLTLLYVGDVIGGTYDIRLLWVIASEFRDLKLIICCPEKQWDAFHQHEIGMAEAENIEIQHVESYKALQTLYDQADIGCMVLKPNAYLAFSETEAVFKFFENKLPVLTLDGVTLSSWIQEQGCGWSVPYQVEPLRKIFNSLILHPEKTQIAKKHIVTQMKQHTWIERAKQVAADVAEYMG